MIKTYVTGIVLGIVAVFVAAYLVPAVDQHRESSLIAVTPNGGIREAFHINMPMDRIVVGARDAASIVPPGLQWPDDPIVDGIHAELFKLRNANDTVIGVASRVAATGGRVADESVADTTVANEAGANETVEWVLHFPARGSVFVSMQPEAAENGHRVGRIRAGTREFGDLEGRLTERWVGAASERIEGLSGRIELVSQFVGTPGSDADGVHASDGTPGGGRAGSEEAPR